MHIISNLVHYNSTWLSLSIAVSWEGADAAAPSEAAAASSRGLSTSKTSADGKGEKRTGQGSDKKPESEGGPPKKALRRMAPMQDEAPAAAKTTAVKAKAKPTVEKAGEIAKQKPKDVDKTPKIERGLSEVDRTVAACLNRKDTEEMKGDTDQKSKNKKAVNAPKDAKKVPPPAGENETSESDSESDAEQLAEKTEKVKRQKEAHARYMRFSRSLKRSLACFLVTVRESFFCVYCRVMKQSCDKHIRASSHCNLSTGKSWKAFFV